MNKVLKDIFLKNIWMKLLSIVLAVITWCGIMNISDPNIRVTIKQISVTKHNEETVTGNGKTYEITKGDNINIVVSGPRSIVQKLTNKDINAYVDLKELSFTSVCPIHVEFKNEHIANSVEIVSKSEDVMSLTLENMDTKHIPIQVEKIGSLDGYFAIAEADPLMVEVYASESMLNQIEKFVATVDITDKRTSFTERSGITAYTSSGEVIDETKFNANIKDCDVKVTMYHTKVINIVMDTKVSCEYGFGAEEPIQAPATVEIAAPSDVLSDLTEVVIPANFENVKETINANINIKDYLPEGCYIVSDVDMVSITVPVVMLNVEKEIKTTINNIGKSTLSDRLRINNLDGVINVKVWGAEGKIDSITADELGLYLDLKDVKVPGVYNLPLKCKNNLNIILDECIVTVDVGTNGTEADKTE